MIMIFWLIKSIIQLWKIKNKKIFLEIFKFNIESFSKIKSITSSVVINLILEFKKSEHCYFLYWFFNLFFLCQRVQ